MRKAVPGWALRVLVGAIFLLALTPLARAETRSVPYSEFLSDVKQGRVDKATILEQRLQALYRDGTVANVNLPGELPSLPSLMIQYGVKVVYGESETGPVGTFFYRLIPFFLILSGILWMSRREGDGGASGVLSMEQSPGRLYRPGADPVTMRDVAGMDEVKEELQEVVDFLRTPERYRELGARIPRGVLLSGPPGTGKTLLARAVAGEAGVPFLSMAGSDFVEMYAGVGAARVRSLFARAREYAPCILFIDEIDAVARHRGIGMGGGAEERDQTINQLLVEMDGFTPSDGIILMAATNRLDILDPAILRPGRFDRQILVDPPDRQGRREILAVHAQKKPLAADVSLESIAALTAGFTGADLANLLNEAALLAARHRQEAIGMAELVQAYERVVAGGPARQREFSLEHRRSVAYHEAGHALLGRFLEGPNHVMKLSIIPRGQALGYVLYQQGEEHNLIGRREGLNRLACLLGGRAAEEVALGERFSGAADDMERATEMARAMVAEWGMHPAIGPMCTASTGGVARLSEYTQRAVDGAVRGLVGEGYQLALALVQEHRPALERVVAALMERETLEGPELEQLLTDKFVAQGGSEEHMQGLTGLAGTRIIE